MIVYNVKMNKEESDRICAPSNYEPKQHYRKPFLSSHVSSPRGHEISVLPLRSRHSEGRGCQREIGLARTLTARPSCCRGSVFLVTCVGKIISRKCAFSSRAV